MRVVVLTKEATDYARTVEQFLRDFTYQTGRELEVMDPESPDGVSFATSYDILEFPTIIAISEEDGAEQQRWTGSSLPTISEVSYYG